MIALLGDDGAVRGGISAESCDGAPATARVDMANQPRVSSPRWSLPDGLGLSLGGIDLYSVTTNVSVYGFHCSAVVPSAVSMGVRPAVLKLGEPCKTSDRERSGRVLLGSTVKHLQINVVTVAAISEGLRGRGNVVTGDGL